LLLDLEPIASRSIDSNRSLVEANKKSQAVRFRACSHAGHVSSIIREVDVDERGKFCFYTPAFKSVMEGIKHSGSEDVTVWTDDAGIVRVDSGVASFEIGGFPVDSFPPAEEDDSFHECNVPAEEFRSAVMRAITAVGKDFPRLEIKLEDSKVRVTGISSARMCTSLVSSSSDLEAVVYVPTYSMQALTSIMTSSSNGMLNLRWSEDSFSVNYDETKARVRTCHGSFPPYMQILDSARQGETKVVMDSSQTRSVMKSFSFFKESKSTVPVAMDFSDNNVKISLHNNESNKGGGAWDIPCKVEGPPVRVGFNPAIVEQALNGMMGTEMRLTIKGPKKPVLLEFVGLETPTILLMPWDLP
jgi:DNA polymerase III sliding clamp (beta) subunit (PCNA family)